MNTWYNIPNETKINAYTQVAERTGMAPYAVEKDWWVVQTLALVFQTAIAPHLVFKGGTSLSKAWKLIDRFSEDIDLAVSRSFFGFEGEMTRTKIANLRKTANTYIAHTFYTELLAKFQEKGLTDVQLHIVAATTTDQDPSIIEVYYPSVIPTPGYIQPRVQIEIGCRSLREPFSYQSFSSLIDEHYPNTDFAQNPINVPVVNPERTLLEKIFLLHEEFQRPNDKIRVDRLSRHLYDIYQLSKTDFAKKAIENQVLYETIVNHRYKFTRVGGVDYKLHQPHYINPIPPPHFLAAWKQDYKTMQEQMIYGDSPSFEELIVSVRNFTHKINSLDWNIQGDFLK